MEDLDHPDALPPRDASHFSGRYVEMWDQNRNSMGLVWVSYRRFLLWEIPANCSRKSLHWLDIYYPNDTLVQELSPVGTRQSVMKPGDVLQWYPGDPEDGDLDAVATPPPCRVPTCPSDLIAGESIGASPKFFHTRRVNRSNQGSIRTDPMNP
jgi:hypothetical protein